jgi:hypothetical protein
MAPPNDDYALCMVLEDFASVVLDRSGPPGEGDEVRVMAKAAYEAAVQGAHALQLLQAVVARKSEYSGKEEQDIIFVVEIRCDGERWLIAGCE